MWVCVLGLGSRLRPATPGLGVGVCVCFLCGLRLYPATPGRGVWSGCVWLGSGFRCAPPLLARVVGCVCVCAPAALVPRHSWLGCAAWLCVLGLGSRLRPATPGWGSGVCVCWCTCSACTPPLLARMCGVCLCAWARVPAASRHSWLVCGGVCVFVCALRLYPAAPGSGVWCMCVCLGSGFGCAPPLVVEALGCVSVCVRAPLVPPHSWLECVVWMYVLGLTFRLRPATPGCFVVVCVCVCVRAPLVPRRSWLGCAVCVCVFGLRFWLPPATPGSAIWATVCLCARSACTTTLLAGMCGVGVCAWARVSAAPCNSWLGRCGDCVFVRPLRLCPATPGWVVRRGCVCLGSGFGCARQLPAWVLGCVCVCVHAPLVPRPSWLGCAVWMCVFGLGFRLRPATPGCADGVCVCLCARSLCTPPLLAGVLGCGRICVRAPLVPRHSCWVVPRWCVYLGSGFGCALLLLAGLVRPCACLCACSACTAPLLLGCAGWVSVLGLGLGCAPPLLPALVGCVCVSVRALLVPRHSWLGRAVWGCVLGMGFWLPPATPGWCVGVCVCLCARSACTPPLLAGVCGVWVGCCLAPVLVLWFVAGCERCPGLRHQVAVLAWHLSVCRGCGQRRASPACLVAPHWCAAPRPVWSLSCSGQLWRRRGAFLHPGGLRPRIYWAAALYPFGARQWGCLWRVLPVSVLGCVRCAGLRMLTRSLTRPVSCTVRLSAGDFGGALGLSCVDTDSLPFRSEDATPGSHV